MFGVVRFPPSALLRLTSCALAAAAAAWACSGSRAEPERAVTDIHVASADEGDDADASAQPEPPDPEGARAEAMRLVEEAGVLGAFTTEGEGLAGAFGAFDAGYSGAVRAADAGAFGSGGLGLRGTGRGGVGTAEGVGIGSIGRGGGTGYGTAGGRFASRRGRAVPGGASVSGKLDRDIIRRIVRHYLGSIRYCYERELRKDPTLSGKIAVRFTIAPSGRVSASRAVVSTGTPSLDACVVARFRRMRFPAPKGGGVVVVTYPIVFSSNGSDAGASASDAGGGDSGP